MDLEAQLAELLRLADQLAIEVRFVPLEGAGGGLCRVKGRQILFVDADADVENRFETVLTALADQDGLDSMFILPQLREQLDRARQKPPDA